MSIENEKPIVTEIDPNEEINEKDEKNEKTEKNEKEENEKQTKKEEKKKEKEQEPKTKEEVIQLYKKKTQQRTALSNQISEAEYSVKEHTIVLTEIKGVDKNRRCWRLVDNILVEKNTEQIREELTKELETSQELVDTLKKQFEMKNEEISEYQKKYNIGYTNEKGEKKDEKTEKNKQQEKNNVGKGVLL
ncbi:prefoldin subunit [Anaeramoeba flamelloides]|uniref:Prefoldin subunit n=1 Tax=Anaeramoeba flamelloides TaxID=1746091 RepID=A0AAV7Z9C4_9EUKA|nr:prefoldin subunit [Anaeramoeba flamelloides]